MGLVWLIFYKKYIGWARFGVRVGSFFSLFLEFQAGFEQVLRKYFHTFFQFCANSGSSLGEFLSHFCFVLGRPGGGFWAFYTFIFVFQAYLEVFLEALFSPFFGFGHYNLGGHPWRPSLKGFKGTFEILLDFFQKVLNHKSYLWSFLNFILVSFNNYFWS
jgi:hypothetical protein